MEEHVFSTFRVSMCHRAHTFQHIEQAHTGLPLPQTPPGRGHQAGGRPAHQAPSLPGHPLGNAKGKENKRDEEVACAGPLERNVRPFVGQANHILWEFLNVKEQLVCASQSCCHQWNRLLSPTHHQGVPVFPTCSRITERMYKLHNKVQSVTYASIATCILSPFLPSLQPSFSPSFLLLPSLLPSFLSFLVTEEV